MLLFLLQFFSIALSFFFFRMSRCGLSLCCRPCSCSDAFTRTRRTRRTLPDRLLLQLGAPRLARVRVGPDLLPALLEPVELAADEAEAGLHGLDGLFRLLPDEGRADELEDAIVGLQGLELLLFVLCCWRGERSRG